MTDSPMQPAEEMFRRKRPQQPAEEIFYRDKEEEKLPELTEFGGTVTGRGTWMEIEALRKQLPKGYEISNINFAGRLREIQDIKYEYNAQQMGELGENGLPVNWDYHGRLGPWGQPLPEGALGWDPYGRPDFGPGVAGWFKREWAEIIGDYNIPKEQLAAMEPVEDEVFDDYQKGLWREGKIGDWAKAWVGRTASEIKYKWSQAEYSENDPNVLSIGARVIGTGFTGIGDALDNVAGAVEWALTPTMLTGDDYIREGNTAITEDMYNIINDFWLLRPSSYLAKSIIGQFAAILDPKYRENIRQYRDLQIWRMGYSASRDVMIRAEYLRRMEQGGEDPRLLAMELANPAEEMIGRMFLDPLNVGAIAALPGKLAKAARVKIFDTASDATRMVKAVPVMSHVMDFLGDASRLSDEFADTAKIGQLAEKVQEGFVAVRSGIDDLAQRRTLRALTARGKRSAMLVGSGHFLKVMAEHFSGNTDEFLEYLHSLVKISSDNIDEVIDGLSTLGNLLEDPKMLEMAFSQAGTETSIILRNLMVDDAGKLRDATKMFGTMDDASDMVAFTNKMYERMVGATTDIFPTVTKQIKLNDELAELIAKHGAEADEVVDFISKNPFAEVQVPKWMRTVDAAHQLVQPVYRLAADVQGVLYMGLSPAYWLRNKFTNFAQIFVDQGGKAAFKSLFFSKVHAEDAIKSYLGFVPRIEGFGGAASWTGKRPGKGVFNWFSNKAATDEARAAAHVMAESIRDTMSKGLHEGRIIPSTVDLTSFTDDMRVGIVRLAQQHNGDVDAVWKALREARKAGGYDISRNLMFLSVDDIEDLKKIAPGFYPRIRNDVLQAETLEDAIRALDDIAEDFAEQGSKHWNETIRFADDKMKQAYAQLDEAMEGMTPAQREYLKDVISIQKLADRKVRQFADKAVESAKTDAIIALAREIPDESKVKRIISAFSDPADEALDTLRNNTWTEVDQLVATHKALTERLIKVGRKRVGRDEALRGIWREVGFGDFVDMPDELTSQFMRDTLWQTIHPQKRGDVWKRFRGGYYTIRRDEAYKLLGAITPEGTEVLNARVSKLFVKTDGEMKLASLLDQLVAEDGKLYIRANLDMQYDHYTRILGTLEEGTEEFEEINNIIKSIDNELRPVAPEAPGERIMESAGEFVPLSVEDARARVATYADDVDEELARLGFDTDEAIKAEQARIADELVEGPVKDLYWETIGEGKRPVSSNAFGPGDAGIWWEDPVTGEKGFTALEETPIMRKMREAAAEAELLPMAERATSALEEAQALLDDTGRMIYPEGEVRFGDIRLEHPSPDAPHIRLSEISVPPEARGQGLATRALEDMKKIADDSSVPLMVEPGAFMAEGLNTEELIAWYKRHGFEELYPDPTQLMEGQTQKYIYVPEGFTTEVAQAGETVGTRIAGVEPPVFKRIIPEGIAPTVELPPVKPERLIPIDEFMNELPLGMADGPPSPVQSMSQTTGKMKELIEKVKAGLNENWGSLREYTFDPRQERQLAEWMNTMKERVTVARAEALDIAQNTRDFILHNYQSRRGIDQLASYIYPYQFWHSRTYAKWMQRLVTEPEWIARYARYRQYLEKKNAGLPDWWKYQLNTNDLPGINMEHPLWFNLEATLNPLYGMTGVDFTAPERRLDWWSSLMEDLNKVGPSIWTPYQLAAAVIYHAQGKEEASSKWAGRMFTGTRFIRDVTAMMGVKGGKGFEADPFVNFFSGGLGPWERARVGRMLGHMQTEGKYTPAEIIDAAYQQEGPIWDVAMSRAINDRALGQSLAFILGTGFKPRSASDMQIDRMYSEIYGLMSKRDMLSDEEYRMGWDDLERRYPFMDAVLMSKKGGLERDEALAWNVLSRIPPGQTDEMAERVGVHKSDITSFYDFKGDLIDMPEAQRLRFQAAILDLAALLDMPKTATQAEWDRARQAYRQMQDIGKTIYGVDIWDKVDTFYASDDKDSFLRHHPIVEEALDWQQETVIRTPILAAYYTSIQRIEKYLKGQMYDEAERLYGADLWDHWEVYHRLKDIDSKLARQHWKDHPQLEGYIDFRDDRLEYIAKRLEEITAMIPEGLPAEFRQEMPQEEYTPDNNKEAWYESQVLSYLSGAGPTEGIPPATMDILAYLQENEQALYYLYLDYLEGEELPVVAKERLSELGIVVQ